MSGAFAGSAPTSSGVCWCRSATCTIFPVCVCFLRSLRLMATLALLLLSMCIL